jgi:hypothetical protein
VFELRLPRALLNPWKPPPETGESAVLSICEKPDAPADTTEVVLEFLLTKTARIETPITAVSKATIPAPILEISSIAPYRFDRGKLAEPPVKLPKLEPPVTGASAAPREPENAEPPAEITDVVLAFLETNVAMIATPTIAKRTVVTDAIKLSDILYFS